MWKPSGRSGRGEDMGLQGAGSGLSKGKLQLATANADDVVSGETFYAGDKELKTGTLAERSGYTNDVSVYNSGNGNMGIRIPTGAYRTAGNGGYPTIVSAQSEVISNGLSLTDRGGATASTGIRKSGSNLAIKIPTGVYRTNNSGQGAPEITVSQEDTLEQLLLGTSIAQYRINLTDNDGSATHTFAMGAGQVILFVAHCACYGGASPTISLTTPNCTNIVNYDSGVYTQDIAYLGNRVFVRVVRVNSAGTATITIRDPNNNVRSVGFMGAWRLV